MTTGRKCEDGTAGEITQQKWDPDFASYVVHLNDRQTHSPSRKKSGRQYVHLRWKWSLTYRRRKQQRNTKQQQQHRQTYILALGACAAERGRHTRTPTKTHPIPLERDKWAGYNVMESPKTTGIVVSVEIAVSLRDDWQSLRTLPLGRACMSRNVLCCWRHVMSRQEHYIYFIRFLIFFLSGIYIYDY